VSRFDLPGQLKLFDLVELPRPAHVVQGYRAPKPAQQGRVECRANGCSRPIDPQKLMCGKHWYMVPQEIRVEVYRHYRPGQGVEDASPAWWLAAAQAVEAVAAAEGRPIDNVFRRLLNSMRGTG
jgi:hypothetical protein